MGLSKSWLWLCFLLGVWTPQGNGKVYPRDIYRRTPKFRRAWTGVEANTGKNFGGWLLRILNSNGNFACGGAYYAPLLVITSANCIYPYRNSLEGATVEGTAVSKCDSENIAEIDTIQFPERFIYRKLYMDVAVVRLKEPIKGRLTEFIRLCTIKLQPIMRTVVFGWGYDSLEVQKPSSDPRNSSVTIISLKECRQKFGKKLALSSTSVCVRQPKNPRNCLYDGGSPMIYKRELCGVVSFGSQCQNTSYPGMFTNIRRVARFIKETEESIEAGYIFRSPRAQKRSRARMFRAPKVKKKVPLKIRTATTTAVIDTAKSTNMVKNTTIDPLESIIC
ncbi:seminase [Drosophila gunungcola]|uniref:seminase n=1 Tax=Drosophila gunungcola TaxID=103775 RepID=UPI0022E1EE72|nr:seminase [Drosophila gunungcola]